MKIGAHVSTTGGICTGFARAEAIGAECMQIFESAPQQWGTAKLDDATVAEFRACHEASSIGPVFIHGKYLMNLASPDPKIFKTSASTLRSSLNIAGRIGAVGVIFHTGSHLGSGLGSVFEQICTAATAVLADTPDDTLLIFENSAGEGGKIGSRFSDLGQILKRVNNPRAKVCIDTCHAFASGYDLSSAAGVADAMAELDREVGFENVAAVHCNDSKTALGAGRDLHENIGAGYIGRDGFAALLLHAGLQEVPFLLEVPGYKIDGAGKGPDKPNIDILKALRDGTPVPEPPPTPAAMPKKTAAKKTAAKTSAARKSSGDA
ncbi:MAG: deoxyribonuclease IV [Chloroflexi bacterium]|nr:deoxyribonuclease IV [Chloroflexota bacterium]